MTALPIVVPLITAVACLAAWRRPAAQRVIATVGAAALCAAAFALLRVVLVEGTQSVQVGAWPPGVAIALVADPLSALMVAVTAVVALAGVVYSLGDIDGRLVSFGYFPLFHLLIMGVCGAFITADMFNLFVWFEVMLITSFALMSMGGARRQMTGAIKYVSINLISSALFLTAVGALYAVCHSLSMAELSDRLAVVAEARPSLVLALSALLAVSFAIKAGLFPVFFWLPASYHTPPPAISALFAGLLTKVGVYALLRVFGQVFPPQPALFDALLAIAAVTVVVGVLGAVAQGELRRILGFHIVSQIGYIAVGVALVGADDPSVRRFGVAAAVFYTIHHIVVKTNLFFAAGVIERLGGSASLERLGGLVSRGLLAALFAIPALSLAGVPPLSGFWAKLAALQAVLMAGGYAVAAALAVGGLLTLISMTKIWHGAFWRPARTEPTGRIPVASLAPMVALAAVTVAIGVAPQVLFGWAELAADALLAPAGELAAPVARGGTS